MKRRTDAMFPRNRGTVAEAIPYVIVAGAVFLAWQIVLQPLIQRAPVGAVVRIAPTSSIVLRRAAEAEYLAGRNDNAAVLAREALARTPFDVRALRVIGLTEAKANREGAANELMTLAGNWSLRDDPAHAWLVEYRLRRGDYSSAFAHADTLVRRREDIQPQIFNLFTTAVKADPDRTYPVLANLLGANPPWRSQYLRGLYDSAEGLQVASNLAIHMQRGPAPLSDAELGDLYAYLVAMNPAAVRTVQLALNRPSNRDRIINGGFGDEAPKPFQWNLFQGSGAVVEIVEDDVRPENPALRVDYNGYAVALIAEQLIFLAPGDYRFAAETRRESGDPTGRLKWTMTCTPSGLRAADLPLAVDKDGEWNTWSARMTVPAGCTTQWLRLEGVSADRRLNSVVWLDNVTVTPLEAARN